MVKKILCSLHWNNKDVLYRWQREYHKGNDKYAFPGNEREALTLERERICEREKSLKETGGERDDGIQKNGHFS